MNQNGQFVVTDENSRYTENMLNTYGTEWVNRDGVVEGGMTLGAHVRAFAERLARIKRRAVPDECFRDKGLMSKWIDGNR